MAIILVLHLALRGVLGPPGAALAGLATVTSPLALEGATSGLVNMTLALGVTLAILGAFFMLEGTRRAPFHAVVCGVGLAVGFLTKGPIVLLFFGPALLAYVGFRRGGRLTMSPRRYLPWFGAAALAIWLVSVLSPVVGPVAALLYVVALGMIAYFSLHGPSRFGRSRWWFLAVGVAVVLIAPWPVLVVERLGLDRVLGTLKSEFWRERVVKVGSSNVGPVWLYLAYFPASTLPWSLLLPFAFLPGRSPSTSDPRGRLLLLARCWLVGSLVLFSVVGESRKMRYLIPAFPAVSILAADVVLRAMEGGFGATLMRRLRRAFVPAVAAIAVLFLGAKIWLAFPGADAQNRKSSLRPACEAIRAAVPPGEAIHLAGLPSVSAAFYLDSVPYRATAQAGARRPTYVVTEAEDLGSFEPPPGCAVREVARADHPGGQFVLLRLDPSENR